MLGELDVDPLDDDPLDVDPFDEGPSDDDPTPEDAPSPSFFPAAPLAPTLSGTAFSDRVLEDRLSVR